MSTEQTAPAATEADRIDWFAAIPFFAVHIAAVVGVVMLGWSWKGAAFAAFFYYLRMFGITAGFHRYFAHRSYKMGRVMQFLMAFLGMMSTQKGVLWWAAHHRHHHKFSDKPEDIHSMKLRGFLWSHVGWILARTYNETEWDQIKDFAKYPELRFLNRFHLLPTLVFTVALFAIGGPWALVWGYFVSTSFLWHGTFFVNSLAHWLGNRRYATTDESKNSLTIALLTMGEGWHNNHHYFPKSARQGFYWWEIDVSYYILRAFNVVGLVWDLETPPAKVRDRRMGERGARQARVEVAPQAVAADDLEIAGVSQL